MKKEIIKKMVQGSTNAHSCMNVDLFWLRMIAFETLINFPISHKQRSFLGFLNLSRSSDTGLGLTTALVVTVKD